MILLVSRSRQPFYVAVLIWLASTYPALGDEYSWSFVDEVEVEVEESSTARHKLKLKQSAAVNTDWVEVGDVANCIHDDPKCLDFLNLSVMRSPPPGKTERISVDQVKNQLLEENTSIVFEADDHSYIEIESLAQEISADEVKASLNGLLDTFSRSLDGIKVKVSSLTLLKPWFIRPHEFQFEFTGWSSLLNEDSVARLFKLYKQRTKLVVREVPLDALNAPSERIALVKLDFHKPVLLARELLQRGQVISEDLFAKEWRHIRSKLDGYPSSLNGYKGFALKRSLSPGSVLSFSHLEKPLAVKRGQLVLMELGSGAYVVTAKVRAKQPGRPGETIEVVYEPTKKRLRAKVINSNLLRQVSS